MYRVVRWPNASAASSEGRVAHMTNIAAALAALCTLLKDKAGLSAAVGRPAGAVGIHIWPWQLVPSTGAMSPPLVRPPSGGPGPVSWPMELRVLLVSSGTQAAIDDLSRAHRVLVDDPVLQLGDSRIQIVPSPLSAADLAAIFTAGRVPLSLSSSFTLLCSL